MAAIHSGKQLYVSFANIRNLLNSKHFVHGRFTTIGRQLICVSKQHYGACQLLYSVLFQSIHKGIVGRIISRIARMLTCARAGRRAVD